MGMASLIWLLFRTGAKPTRIVYPCQRAAVDNISIAAHSLLPVTIIGFFSRFHLASLRLSTSRTKEFFKRYWKPILALAIIVPSLGLGVLFLGNVLNPPRYPGDVNLILTSQTATASPASDIYVVNGRSMAHISNLINLMGSQGLLFYESSASGVNQGPLGLIAANDVILIKINSQWDARGGTNTDLLRELIQAIIDHPNGFRGEIIVADNGQSFGDMDWDSANAENTSQSVQDVVNIFSSQYRVSTYDWQSIYSVRVNEYLNGDMTDGYWLNDTADPETGINVSYPKFQSAYGTYISFKHGIWNGASYEDRLKIINLPILKSHRIYGVTAATKHYMGVQSEGTNGGLANGHAQIGEGGMGTLLAETRYPILNILDAIWINANPYPSVMCGPYTGYIYATRVNIIMASLDPVALDYWASKNVLIPTAQRTGYDDVQTLDPDNMVTHIGLTDAFGIYLTNTSEELVRNGYSVTMDETQMNVYVSQFFASNSVDNMSAKQLLDLFEENRED